MKPNSDASFLGNLSGEWLQSLYEAWSANPAAVPEQWRRFFSGFELGAESCNPPDAEALIHGLKQSAVQSLIYRYRSIGHLLACIDPLSPCPVDHPLLSLSAFDLDPTDLDTSFTCRRFLKPVATLTEIVSTLRDTYCRSIGVEFMHIQDPEERQWLIDRMEPIRNAPPISMPEKLGIYEKLQEATIFESFLHRRFVGQKRFSLEGGEVLIPVLDAVVQRASSHGIAHLVMGMSHRGRLNVLAHIFRKPYQNIFAEFRENVSGVVEGDGDVKYHRGHSIDLAIEGHRLHLTLAPNPSHLEAVNPVVEGKCRALQDTLGPQGTERVLPLLIHGDSAFSGQGSVMETLNMSRLEGYETGGTLHIVLNNQIGFTTLPHDARSTQYATDIAKMLACPIFHVQGEHPEAAVHAVQLALEYRQTFHNDVVVELICYRRRGHNEGDEPAFTQPRMYRSIGSRPTAVEIYAEQLTGEGISPEKMHAIEGAILERLRQAEEHDPQPDQSGYRECWGGVERHLTLAPVKTGVPTEKLRALAGTVFSIPSGFTPHPKVAALMAKRLETVMEREVIDWGTAEILAYGSLLDQGVPVRISGQDSQRGTFNHRHAVLHDMENDSFLIPLSQACARGGRFQIWNSLLSEFAVLGFEYGYSLKSPFGLVIWEAQFGDFANGAQVIIDQFIVSGEAKWNRASGLVMLLPHGYEGQGAEHSSARIERFLQLCAGGNMLIANPTTPSQMFHLLRRQIMQPFRKPLVVFTPKSLLRHPRCVSTLAQLDAQAFSELIVEAPDPARVQRVLICSGKIYYDLAEEIEKRGAEGIAIVRVEQLYPFRDDLLMETLSRFPADSPVIWVQEEPENMGPWPYLAPRLSACRPDIQQISRSESCSPAVGSHRRHGEEQAELIRRALEF